MRAKEFITLLETKTSHRITLKPERVAPVFVCPTCSQPYNTVDQMTMCLNQPFAHGPFEVGDIVIASGQYTTWGIGKDDPWLAFVVAANPKSESHFDHVDQYYPWYVITSLWNQRHREVCSLVSLAGDKFSGGWNPTIDNTHCALFKDREEIARHRYWSDQFKGVAIREPSRLMRAEAAMVANTGAITPYLI